MELYIAEYQKAFGEARSRLVVFQAPNITTAKSVAGSMRGAQELVYGVMPATQALDFQTDFVKIEYRTKKIREPKKRIIRIKRRR